MSVLAIGRLVQSFELRPLDDLPQCCAVEQVLLLDPHRILPRTTGGENLALHPESPTLKAVSDPRAFAPKRRGSATAPKVTVAAFDASRVGWGGALGGGLEGTQVPGSVTGPA